MVYRRPRPTLGSKDEERASKLAALRKVLAELPDDETAVFQDEIDINANPKIGSRWMVKGRQAKVETPGNNEKGYLGGSIHWRTGQVFLTEGVPKQGRSTALFLKHLDELRSRLRRCRKIHVICDKSKCRASTEVAMCLHEHREQIDLHFLPSYSPECNPIERVWWNLHDQITRNLSASPRRSCWSSPSPGSAAGTHSRSRTARSFSRRLENTFPVVGSYLGMRSTLAPRSLRVQGERLLHQDEEECGKDHSRRDGEQQDGPIHKKRMSCMRKNMVGGFRN